MNDIENRKDVELLVHTFYDRIRKDEMLGHIFNTMIPDEKWPEHLSKLSDFWETNLFGVRKFKGNPIQAHLNTDAHFNYTIEQPHFGQWLHLWFSTIDSLFEGEKALRAKNSARNMATGQFLAIYEGKKAHLEK